MRLLPILAIFALSAGAAPAPSAAPVIAGADPYVAVPHGALTPGKASVYRAVFEARHGAEKPDQLAPAIAMAAAEVNSVVGAGGQLKNLHFAIVFHTTPVDEALLDNAHYRAKYGVDNPNLPILAQLKKAGVILNVCGQQLQVDGVDFKSLTPDVTIVTDGLIALMYYQNRGYALLTF